MRVSELTVAITLTETAFRGVLFVASRGGKYPKRTLYIADSPGGKILEAMREKIDAPRSRELYGRRMSDKRALAVLAIGPVFSDSLVMRSAYLFRILFLIILLQFLNIILQYPYLCNLFYMHQLPRHVIHQMILVL